MNKNQKYLAENPYHPPPIQPKLVPKVSTSHSKQIGNTPVFLIYSIEQETQLLQHLSWRCQTKAPIVSVLSYSCEQSDYGFPKIYRIEIQPMARTVQSLREICLADSLYLIRTIIAGVQFLASACLKIDMNEISYNINHKNECKIWVSNNFVNFRPATSRGQSPIPPHAIVASIFNSIYAISTNAAKLKLHQLIQENKNYRNVSFERILKKVDGFIAKKGIIIGQALGKNESRLQEKEMATSLREEKPKCESKPIKVNFRYYSPNSKQAKELEHKIGYKSCFLQKSRPKVVWHYQNNQNIYRPRLTTTPVETNIEKTPKIQQHLENRLKSSQILKNKLKQGKSNTRELSQEKVKTNTQIKSTGKTEKNSILTTEISQLVELSKIHENISEIKKDQACKTQTSPFLSIPNLNQKILSSVESTKKINDNEKEASKKWEFKLTNLFPNNQQELKRSIYCGQQVRSPSLDVKLQFLGHMGREITSTIQDSLSF